MINLIKHLLVLNIFLTKLSYSQQLVYSNTYVQSCYDKKDCFSINNSSLIFFNPNNNEIILEVDFSKFKLGNDTLDEWLHDLEKSHLVFRGSLNTNDLLSLSHHNTKPIQINGLITFNGITKPYNLEINIFEIANTGIMFLNNSQDYFDRVNVNMHLGFYPKEFGIDKKQKHFKKSITIALYRGYLNQYRPEIESLLQNK